MINTRSSVHLSLAWQRTEALPLRACPLAGLPTDMEKAHGRLQGRQHFPPTCSTDRTHPTADAANHCVA